MAYINDLLENHTTELSKFKSRIGDILPKFRDDFYRHDVCIFKFLVARDYDLDKAEELMRKHIEWRQEHKIDSILKMKVPKAVWDTFPWSVTGVDKRGCAVVYHPMGKWNGKKGIKMGWRKEMQTILRQGGEIMLELARSLSTEEKPVCQYYVIVDLDAFDITQLLSIELVKLTREILQDYLDNFPELVSYVRVINAPKLYRLAWAVVEPVLTGRTISKIEIYGTNKDEWKTRLIEECGADNLPSYCGGAITTCFSYNNTDLGLNCFPKYENIEDSDFKDMHIPAGQTHTMEILAENEGQQLSWNFTTDDYDIGFQVCTSDGRSVVNYCRVDSHKYTQKGSIDCEKGAKYILSFDNSFSKFKGKTLHYVVQMKAPIPSSS